MPGLPILRVAGLHTAHNPFSGAPDGGLAVAKNVVFAANGITEPRRGAKQLSYTLTNSNTALSNSGTFFGASLVVQHDASSLSHDTGSVFSTYSGTLTPPDDTLLRTKFVEAQENLYFTTDNGVKVLASTSATPTNYNIPPPRWDAVTTPGYEVFVDAGGSWFEQGQMAMRATYVYTDPHGIEHASEPSERLVVRLTTAIAGYPVLHMLGEPTLDVANTVVRYYRSAETALAVDPGDEVFLFQERAANSFDVGNFQTTYFVSDPGSPSADALYTNPRTGDGILQANTRPPLARDMALWRQRVWYADTTSRQSFPLNMLGVGSPNGVQVGDTITIGGFTYTGSASPAASNRTFLVYSDGTAAENIERTARSLVSAVNNWNIYSSSGPLRARYLSGANDTPGQMRIEADGLTTTAFTVYASRTASWNPVLTTSDTGSFESSGDRFKNGLFYSKPDQPEAVPLLNYLFVGPKNKEILRAVPLRDKLYVFSEAGLYAVTGEEPFSVDLVDRTCRLVSPDSVQELNNQLFALTTQGVVSISHAGLQLLSRGIEDQLFPYLNPLMRSTVKRYAFGLAHETDRTYELWLPGPGTTDSRVCNKAFVYSTVTGSWTTWEGSERTWGAVSPDGVKYYGSTDGKVLKERRDYAASDYADEEVTTSGPYFYTSTTVGITSASGDFVVGDALVHTKDNISQSVTITAIGGYTLTVSEPIITALQSGATVTVDRAFESAVTWLPVAFNRPGSLKRFQYGTLHFQNPTSFITGYATYETELSSFEDTEDATPLTTNGWGTNAWGSSHWGDPTKNFNARHTIPAEKQRAAMVYPGFRIKEARATWKLDGLTLDTEETSERSTR